MAHTPTFDNDISREGACTGGFSTAVSTVSVFDLEVGMFVEELDKPWIESPFMLQGFFIETDEQIRQLRDECLFVKVNQASLANASRRRRDAKRRLQLISGGRD
ncbi:MAG: DUF3391 domain-containing protein [Pseudomonadota bacterium]